MYIMWARGKTTLKLENDRFPLPKLPPQDSGIKTLQILRADSIKIPEKDLKEVEIRLRAVTIPNKETTYFCHIQRLDKFFSKKHHIVQFEPLITSKGYVHHMEIFHCEAALSVMIPAYTGECHNLPASAKPCTKVMALWAMGANKFTYPPETGLPVGGKDYNPYVRLEVHFNNPDLHEGIVDSSGILLKIVSKLRKYDAAVMELGLEYTDKMAIPPRQIGFPLNGYCISECTDVGLPKTGIIIFGSQLHTHLRGVRILTRHFRGDNELREINRDDFYSHNFQEMRNLQYKSHILPGDALVTTCYYNTKDNENVTLGGFALSDEMCVNYVHYYPSTQLEVCKSSVSEGALQQFFMLMKTEDHQINIHLNGAISKNYESIKWTPSRINKLYQLYIQKPLTMSCNKSDGHRFKGFNWEGAPVTKLKLKVPVHRSFCPKFNPLWEKPLEDGNCDFLGECIY